MLQLALLAALANVAIAVVSAQDPVVFKAPNPLSGSLTNCGTSGPLSCDGNPSEQNLCCYEYPGVSCIRYPILPTRVLARAQTDARLRGCYCKHRYARGSALNSHQNDKERGVIISSGIPGRQSGPMTAGRFMVRDLNLLCARSGLLNEVVRCRSLGGLVRIPPISGNGQLSDQSTSAGAKATSPVIPVIATRAVITQTSVKYVVCSRVVHSSDASSGSSS
jgi:hypothetical protein